MHNPMDMSGRTVMVTGASAGLGAGIARLLARLGAKIVLVGRDAARLEAVRIALGGGTHEIRSFGLDNPDQIAPWMQEVTKSAGPLHGLVHSAGVMLLRPLRILRTEEWESAMRINVVAASALTKGFRQKGVNAGGGSVVYLASVAGLTGQPAQSLYGATKGALIAMTRSLAVELAREQIRVNCVAPAVVEAGMSEQIKAGVAREQWEQIIAQHPLGLGRTEDVANAVAFLLADTGRWITGTTLVVDGGYTAQ